MLSDSYKTYTPYNYVVNNPIRLIDPNGMETAPAYNWETGEYEVKNKKGKTRIVSWEYVQQSMGLDQKDDKEGEGEDPIKKAEIRNTEYTVKYTTKAQFDKFMSAWSDILAIGEPLTDL